MDAVQVYSDVTPDILLQVAQIHRGAYSGGHFTSTFDLSHLVEYNRLMISHSEVSMVVIEDQCVLGYLIAGENVSNGVSEFISANRLYLIGRFLRHPQFLIAKIYWKLLTTLTKTRKSAATFRLLSIATAPAAQSHGVGARLLSELEGRLKDRGVKMYGLSVLTRNTRAVEFYKRHGFLLDLEQLDSTYFYKTVT